MPNNATSFGSHVAEEAMTLGDKLSDSVTQIRDTVTSLGTAAAHKIDENRKAAASGLKKAASTVHENAGTISGGDQLTKMAHSAADALDSTGNWVGRHSTSKLMSDVSTLVKNNPGPSLLAAVVVGFFVGRSFNSNSR